MTLILFNRIKSIYLFICLFVCLFIYEYVIIYSSLSGGKGKKIPYNFKYKEGY